MLCSALPLRFYSIASTKSLMIKKKQEVVYISGGASSGVNFNGWVFSVAGLFFDLFSFVILMPSLILAQEVTI